LKLKVRPVDFKVFEQLREGVLEPRGEHRVYRVTKRKRSSLEAAEVLAELAGVSPGQVSMAGLKDRQAVTHQFMSIPRGRSVRLQRPEIGIEPAGFARHEISSADSQGNLFEIVVRDLGPVEIERLRAAVPVVREHGLPNYFDEQRFGNLRHKQGWIALELMRGQHELALRRLLTAVSDFDPPREQRFKSALYRHWGDWRACRDVAGRFGRHHSVFEHLRRESADFGGAFRFVASRTRLIHLYAYQSHVWNRAVVQWIEESVPAPARFGVSGVEGRLVFVKGALRPRPDWNGAFQLPGSGLDDVADEVQRRILAEVLARDRLEPHSFRIDGVPGFALKGEPRPVAVRPAELRVRPAEPDPLNPGRKLVKLRFALPRGSYATLVVRRLIGQT